MLRTVSNVAALCPSPEGALATGRERGMTAGHGVRFRARGVQRGLAMGESRDIYKKVSNSFQIYLTVMKCPAIIGL